MSIETLLKGHVGPLLTGGCHNGVNRSSRISLPYAVFHEISGIPDNGISAGYEGPTRHRYQIDVFASSPEQAKGLALGDIKSAVETGVEGTLIFQMSGQYSELEKSYQYITEYQMWST